MQQNSSSSTSLLFPFEHLPLKLLDAVQQGHFEGLLSSQSPSSRVPSGEEGQSNGGRSQSEVIQERTTET